MDQTSPMNANPVLNVNKNGTILYSNEAGYPLLKEWGVKVGEKLPPHIRDIVRRVISLNNPEKTEVKAENRTYLIVFSPLPEQELVSISGFDISDHKEQGEETQQSEERLRALMDHNPSLLFMKDECGRYVYLNNAYEKQFVHSKDWYGKTDFDFWPKESAELFRANDSLVLKSGKMHQFMEDSTDLNGKRYCWLDYKFPFTDSRNKKYVGGIGIDATDRERAEEALQESEERYRMLFTSMTEGFVLVEVIYNEDSTPSDYRYLEMNPIYEISTGIKREEALGKRIYEVFPNINPLVIEKLREVELSGQSTNFEMFSQVVNRYYDIHMFIPQKGKIAGIFEDITERKVAEDALKKVHFTLEEKILERTKELEIAYNSLKENEISFAEAQKMAHIGNWVWDVATDKAYWSKELYHIFGRDPQKLAPTINEFYNYIHPDDRHDIVNLDNKALNEKSSLCKEFRILSDDGKERRVHMLSEIIFNEKNVPIRIKGIVQDITERKKAEEKIKDLANIVESSEDAIGTISLDGIITSWNKGAEQIYGYPAEEVLGKHVSILSPSHLDKETMKLVELIKQGVSNHQYESLRLGKDGKKIYVLITYSPVFDNNGKLTAISIIGRDMTERKRAEEALSNFEIARKKEIHHRIKNNLQVISSLLDLEAQKFNGKKNIEDSDVMGAFKESQDRVISMALIHKELYKGGKLDTLNFSHYIKELANNLLLTYRLVDEGISLKKDIEEDIYFDMDTAVPLGIIINELLSNSLKYAFPDRENGEIQIKLHREEGKRTAYILSLTDNGIGIPEDLDIEDLDSLGLQLVTTLVDQLDGELELQRDNGTEFIIRFCVSGNKDQELTQDQLQKVDND